MLRLIERPRTFEGGFTLIELMITVAIAAILGTIAMTSYTSQIQKSRRTDGRSAVMDLAGREEKLFSTVNAYSATPSQLGYFANPDSFPVNVGSNYYSITVTNPTPNTFLITATAINAQAKDTRCATLSVDNFGLQTSTGTDTVAACWGN
jgi:type IV pilus assembly protein PilE